MKLTEKIVFVILLLRFVFSRVFFFEPFKSTEPDKVAGLGLNISHNIIRNHGSTIMLNEDYHKGAHLIIKIPEGDKKNDGKTNTSGN